MSFIEVTEFLFQGFATTVLIFIITLVAALPLGLLVSFCSKSKFAPLKWITKTLVWIIRGTPLMLQIMAVYYGTHIFNASQEGRVTAVCVAFILNYAAYFSEIFRGGIESIDKGQYEAGQVLGMTKTQIFFKIVLVQVIKRITAPMGNEIITLVKDTSLANIIGVAEIIYIANDINLNEFIYWPIFYTGIYYLLFVGILTLLFNWLEKKLSYFN